MNSTKLSSQFDDKTIMKNTSFVGGELRQQVLFVLAEAHPQTKAAMATDAARGLVEGRSKPRSRACSI